MINGHGGNVISLARQLGCRVDEIIDMSCNLNPLGPPEGLESFLQANISTIRALPSPDALPMVEAFCGHYQITTDRVLAGNGTTWFLYMLPQALKTRHMVIVGPTYADYEGGCAMHNIPYAYFMTDRHHQFEPDLDGLSALLSETGNDFDTVVICNPNNPTGTLVHKLNLLAVVAEHPHIRFIVDESYLSFVENASSLSLVTEDRFDNLIVLSSMSKIFRIPGLRTGFVCAHPRVIDSLLRYYQPWSVNALAQSAVIHLFENRGELTPFIRESRAFIKREKKRFYDLMDPFGDIELFPSNTYFILARLTGEWSSSRFCEAIGRDRILIRDCANFEGLSDRYVRFSLSTRDHNNRLLQSITHSTQVMADA